MRVKALFAVLSSSATVFCYGQSKLPAVSDFYGRWTVTEVVGYADMGGGVPYAKELLGTEMVISADGITFARDTCRPKAGYRVVKVDAAADLRANAGASLEDAELPRKVVMLKTGNCIDVYWLNSRTIEIDAMGVFLRAYREQKSMSKGSE
jgi:hypothetical protein